MAASRGSLVRVGLIVAIAAVLAVLVMPGRLWIGQRDAIAEARTQLDELTSDNHELQARVDYLISDSLIERQAREEFGRVMVGDELYMVPPPPEMVVDLPKLWPFTELQDVLAESVK